MSDSTRDAGESDPDAVVGGSDPGTVVGGSDPGTVAGRSDPGTVVRDARDRVEALAADGEDGAFTVACKETGVSPEPLAGRTFDTHTAAEEARAAADEYRAAMRSLDPDLPAYDLVVCEADTGSVEVASVRESTAGRRANGLPDTRRTATVTGGRRDEWLSVENAPVVYLTGRDGPLDDEFLARQIDAKL
mgnify:CR=1 FL=1